MQFQERKMTLLDASGLDMVYITSPKNIYYYSGFTGTTAQLLLTANESFIFTDSRYHIQARQQAKDFSLIDTAKKTVPQYLTEQKVNRLGFEDHHVTFDFYTKLKEKIKDAEFIPISDIIMKNRQIKEKEEIQRIKKAAQIADQAFSYILKEMKAGMSEKQIAFLLEIFMRKNGAEKLSFDTICASGKRSALPHGTATDKLIEKGDFLTLDYGCIYDCYCSDMTRTVVMGSASDKQKEIYELVLKAQKTALEAVRPEAKAKDVDAIARNIIAGGGHGEHFGHGLGHSLGLTLHENPTLSYRSDEILKENMLVTVEPGIYIEDFGGVRIEDLVLVTAQGYENLTTSDKQLIELK